VPLIPLSGRLTGLAKTGQAQARPNVLILVFDSLAAQHMSVYGYARSTTPHLERFAARSNVYHAHYAAGNFTSPGTASLLTGVYPWTHRAFNLAAVPLAEFTENNLFSAFGRQNYYRLAYSHNRLADFLLYRFRTQLDAYIPRAAFLLNNRQILPRIFWGDRRIASLGEELAFVRQNQSSLFLSLLDQMFSPVLSRAGQRESFPRGLPEAFRANFVLESAVDGIHAALIEAPHPFVGYFHLLPPHEPYRTRMEFKDCFTGERDPDPKPAHFFTQNQPGELLNQLRRSYDEYLAYADAEFGRLIDLLDQSGLLDNTVVVVTADHGQLFERGIHGHVTPVLYDPVVRVPLLIYDPNQNARRDIHIPTSAVDLLPTLLSLAGGPVPDWCEGVVLPPYQTGAPQPDRSIYAIEAKQNARNRPLSTATVAVIQERIKLISYNGYRGFTERAELYDLGQDPEERIDLVSVRNSTAEAIRHDLELKLQAVNRPYRPHT